MGYWVAYNLHVCGRGIDNLLSCTVTARDVSAVDQINLVVSHDVTNVTSILYTEYTNHNFNTLHRIKKFLSFGHTPLTLLSKERCDNI